MCVDVSVDAGAIIGGAAVPGLPAPIRAPCGGICEVIETTHVSHRSGLVSDASAPQCLQPWKIKWSMLLLIIIYQADASCCRPLFSIITSSRGRRISVRYAKAAAPLDGPKKRPKRVDTRGERREDKKEKNDETERSEGKKESI